MLVCDVRTKKKSSTFMRLVCCSLRRKHQVKSVERESAVVLEAAHSCVMYDSYSLHCCLTLPEVPVHQ